MLKKLLLAVVTLIATMGFAFAQVDVNKADQAALDGVKGIGPKMSKMILDERKKGGEFKDWTDFETRVKGVGEKSSSKLSQAGLTVNGQAKPNAPAAKAKDEKKEKASSASASAKPESKNAETKKADAKKPEAKKDEKPASASVSAAASATAPAAASASASAKK